MADYNGHLVPVFIIYADGARLDTEHEGAVRRIRVSDRLDGVGRCVIEFGHPAAALLEKGAIVPESAVDVHLGYKDDCAKVFGGEVTGLEYGYSEHCGEYLRVTVSGKLHRLRNAVRSVSYERKTAGGFVTEMLDRYGLKADIEDFGPEREVSVHHLESDWDFLIEHAKRYGRSVYEWDGTVYVRNEITVSQEDIVLEFGKSIISFRVKESFEGQISKCTYTGWNMLKAEGVTGSATLNEIPVKAGGGTSWSDEARILPGMWESVIDSQGVTDAEDARNRALGELQNASMEWQRAEVRCEGDHRIRPGMRVTLKYVGERFSGEYVAERVEHEFGIDGFITEVHLRRNMLPGEPKRASAIDEERERQHNGGGAAKESAQNFVPETGDKDIDEEISDEQTVPTDAADNLIAAQDAAMNNPIYQEGGGGPFGNSTGTDTWCNQATFEIARDAAPGLADAMYGTDPNGYNTTANMAAANLVDAAATADASITEVEPQEAQQLANQGYTVVAAWENPTGASGHLATVRPGGSFDEKTGPVLNNIGPESTTGVIRTSKAFGMNRYANGNVHFYYDSEQFR